MLTNEMHPNCDRGDMEPKTKLAKVINTNE